jgi:shikimate dehydrogenase
LSALAGVLGFPVSHSRSPAMMNAAFRELGLDWRYLRLALPPERFAEAVPALPGSGYRGANVTIPHKVAAHGLAGELSDSARAIGAVNTLGEPVSGTALVLGAGGAARAAAWALAQAGAEVTVWSRAPEHAAELAADLGVGHSERPGPSELMVNATSVGLRAGDTLEGLPLVDARLVVDLVYGAEVTPVVRWAEERGARVVDGLEVLVRQGARSLALWTGEEPPVEVMRRAVLQPPV